VPSGWSIVRGGDSVTLAGEPNAEPLTIATNDQAVRLGFIQFSQSGGVVVTSGTAAPLEILLRSVSEQIVPFVVGGPESSVASVGQVALVGWGGRGLVATALWAVLLGIQFIGGARRSRAIGTSPAGWEIVLLAAPLLASSVTVLLAFNPGNVSYDGSLQWVQAVGRGELYAPLGYPTTYFFRFMSLFDASPVPLICLQSVAAAFGVSLVLRELRYRGVPLVVALFTACLLAFTPAYPALFTSLGKDALCAVGVVLFSFALLRMLRPNSQAPAPQLVMTFVISAVFAGLMRSNIAPVISLVAICALALLYWRYRGAAYSAAGAALLIALIAIPGVLAVQAEKELRSAGADINGESPGSLFMRFYAYHFFSAAVAERVPIATDDAALFFRIAPESAWEKYNCVMTDETTSSVTEAALMRGTQYQEYLKVNKWAMLRAVGRIILEHPGLLARRQACVSRMLWQIGLWQKPFQSTVTLGYDSVDWRFVQLAGESHSIHPDLRQSLLSYLHWTEGGQRFWLFWRPALPLLVGLFAVSVYLLRRRDDGVLLTALIPLLSTLLLMIIIPFPAYRYAYPAVLMSILLTPLLFARFPVSLSGGNVSKEG